MKLFPANITIEQITEKFAPNGTSDGIQLFNEKGRSVGYVTDLKVKYCQDYNSKAGNRKAAQKKAAARKEIIGDLAQEMEQYLQSELNVGKVFINETMPNVDVNGQRFYVIIGNTLENSIRLNIRHSEFTADELNDLVTGYKAKSHDDLDPKNAIFGSLSKEDVVSIIHQLADKI